MDRYEQERHSAQSIFLPNSKSIRQQGFGQDTTLTVEIIVRWPADTVSQNDDHDCS